jgi:hypothetical protein
MEIGGEMRGPGRTPSKFVWPTKDIAETMAEKRRGEWEKIGVKYLGAERILARSSSDPKKVGDDRPSRLRQP